MYLVPLGSVLINTLPSRWHWFFHWLIFDLDIDWNILRGLNFKITSPIETHTEHWHPCESAWWTRNCVLLFTIGRCIDYPSCQISLLIIWMTLRHFICWVSGLWSRWWWNCLCSILQSEYHSRCEWNRLLPALGWTLWIEPCWVHNACKVNWKSVHSTRLSPKSLRDWIAWKLDG